MKNRTNQTIESFFSLLFMVIILLIFNYSMLIAEVPPLISYQAGLRDDSGEPLVGSHELLFNLYTEAAGGEPVWTEEHTVELDSMGLYNVMLGSITSFAGEGVDFSVPYWLGISVDRGPEMGRHQIGTSPYSIHASYADSVLGGPPPAGIATINDVLPDAEGDLFIEEGENILIDEIPDSNKIRITAEAGAVPNPLVLGGAGDRSAFGGPGMLPPPANGELVIMDMLGTDIVTLKATDDWDQGIRVNTTASGSHGIVATSSSDEANWAIYGAVTGTSDSSAGVFGEAWGTSGTTFGVWGITRSNDDGATGILGEAQSTTGMTAGVTGIARSNQTYSSGVIGMNESRSGEVMGVYGLTMSGSGFGVAGEAASDSGKTRGVIGIAVSNTDSSTGVMGYSGATEGLSFGVHGISHSVKQNSAGVYGSSAGDSGLVYGVMGYTRSKTDSAAGLYGFSSDRGGYGVKGISFSKKAGGIGVYGEATCDTANNYGVIGIVRSSKGSAGVAGLAKADTGEVMGLYGAVKANKGFGVVGEAYSDTGRSYGVAGVNVSRSDSAAGVLGIAGHSFDATGMVFGVKGVTLSSDTSTAGVLGLATQTSGITYGVSGINESATDSAAGVYGYTSNSDGIATFGVTGKTASSYGAGVLGIALNNEGSPYGVSGITHGSEIASSGVYGYSAAEDGETFGVFGVTNSTYSNAAGVFGSNSYSGGVTYGVYGKDFSQADNSAGVYGKAVEDLGRTYGVLGETRSSSDSACGVKGIASQDDGEIIGVHGLSKGNLGIGVLGVGYVGVMGTTTEEDDGIAMYSAGVFLVTDPDETSTTLAVMPDTKEVKIYGSSGDPITIFSGPENRVAIQKVNSAATPTIPDNNFTISAEAPLVLTTGDHGVNISCPDCCEEPCGGGSGCLCSGTLTVGSPGTPGTVDVLADGTHGVQLTGGPTPQVTIGGPGYTGHLNVFDNTGSDIFSVTDWEVGLYRTHYVAGDGYYTGNLNVTGTKSFYVPHPEIEDKNIRFFCTESDEVVIEHRGNIELRDGYGEFPLPHEFVLMVESGTYSVVCTPGDRNSKGIAASVENDVLKVWELNEGTGNYGVSFIVSAIRTGYKDEPVVVDRYAPGRK